jgi:DGQHR domain-containing protein
MATKKAAKKAAKKTTTEYKKTGKVAKPLTIPAIEVEQSEHKLYVFKARASVLFAALSINRRIEDKDEGYQRVLSPSRVQAITRYVTQKRSIPTAIVISFDKATFNASKRELTVPAGRDVGWVIDGQHRLAGADKAARAGVDIEMPVVAFIGLTPDSQVTQFVTINREAKNVPTSLYLDLLKMLPNKSASDSAKERSADLATQLRQSEDSPFFDKIVVTIAPKKGQVSLTNFVRKIAPLVTQDRGILGGNSAREQRAVISNYYKGLSQVFPREFEAKESMFFKTVGFGALWNAFPTFFQLALNHQKGFEVKDVVAIFNRIDSFDFSSWKEFGSGNQAETLAGEDLKASLLIAFTADDGTTGALRV